MEVSGRLLLVCRPYLHVLKIDSAILHGVDQLPDYSQAVGTELAGAIAMTSVHRAGQPPNMWHIFHLLHLCIGILWIVVPCNSSESLHPKEPARYQKLPSLREQAKIQQAWQKERLARIPMLLRKYNADAWLVSLLESTAWHVSEIYVRPE